MLKIVLTGTESTGKTTLASQLAAHFDTVWVPEFARQYLNDLSRPYQATDLLEIAKGQVALEDELAKKAHRLLFMDTSLEVIKVWSEFKFGACHPWILGQLQARRHDFYFLCTPDLAWAFDPQRENPFEREVLHGIYRRELQQLRVCFLEITGVGKERLAQAVAAVNIYLNPSF